MGLGLVGSVWAWLCWLACLLSVCLSVCLDSRLWGLMPSHSLFPPPLSLSFFLSSSVFPSFSPLQPQQVFSCPSSCCSCSPFFFVGNVYLSLGFLIPTPLALCPRFLHLSHGSRTLCAILARDLNGGVRWWLPGPCRRQQELEGEAA